MRQLHYAGEFVIVDTDVCSAIFDYARALADSNRSDVIKVPIYFGGKRDFSNMLLGPASLLFCTPAPPADVDLSDPPLVAELQRRALALGLNRATAVQAPMSDKEHADAIGAEL